MANTTNKNKTPKQMTLDIEKNISETSINVVVDKDCYPPIKAHSADAGFDLRTPVDVIIPKGKSAVIDTGVHFEIPNGYVGFLKSKSGLNVKFGITTEGVIDSGYTGAVMVKVYNNGDSFYRFERGDKITQIVFLPIPNFSLNFVDELNPTERGDNGFGSSGK